MTTLLLILAGWAVVHVVSGILAFRLLTPGGRGCHGIIKSPWTIADMALLTLMLIFGPLGLVVILIGRNEKNYETR